MATDAQFDVHWKLIGKAGKVGFGAFTVKVAGKAAYTDKFDVGLPDAREKFCVAAEKRFPGIDLNALRDRLEEAAGSIVDDGEKTHAEKMTQAKALVGLAKSSELFHDGDMAYATVQVKDDSSGHHETYPIKSDAFRRWLNYQHLTAYGKPAGGQGMQEAIDALCAKAIHEGKENRISIRLARFENAIYLDLCNNRWQVVRIDREGWRIESDSRVKFIRKTGMMALPLPVQGGSVDELRSLLNGQDDATWRLIVAFLIGALRPEGPFVILAVNGEQGSAKTTTSRMLRQLIDPNRADLRAAPRDVRDLMIAADNSWIIALDNLSFIPADLSDSLCRLASGSGFATRALYTDDGERLFQAARPIIFNGIEELGARPDLSDRAVILQLPSIPDVSRREEAELWRQFELARPRILGALLNAVVEAMRNIDGVKLPSLPRMADFARWVVAAEPALPWPAGSFFEAYTANRADANQLALDSSLLATALQALMVKDVEFEGTAKELLTALERESYPDVKSRSRPEWPKTPKSFSNQLGRIAPALRRVGIHVARPGPTGHDRRRIIRLEYVPQPSSASSAPSPIPAETSGFRLSADGADDADGQISVFTGNSAIGGGR